MRELLDYEVDALQPSGKTYTYTIRGCKTLAAAVKRAARMDPEATWIGNVRISGQVSGDTK